MYWGWLISISTKHVMKITTVEETGGTSRVQVTHLTWTPHQKACEQESSNFHGFRVKTFSVANKEKFKFFNFFFTEC